MKKNLFSLAILLMGFTTLFAEDRTPDEKNCLLIPSFTAETGKSFDFIINMNNELNVTTTEVTITLPEGYGYTQDNDDEDYYGYNEDRSKTSKKNYQQFDSNLLASNKLKIVSFSSNNTPFVGNEGQILTIHCVAPANITAGSFEISMDYEIGCEGGIAYLAKDQKYDFTVTANGSTYTFAPVVTGITNVVSENSKCGYYNVNGQSISANQKGLNIVKTANGVKKVMVK